MSVHFRSIRLLLLTFILVFTPRWGHSQFLQNLFIASPKALALGNAVTADPPGVDSIHFNPAGLLQGIGRQRQLKFVVGVLDSQTDIISTPSYLESQQNYHPSIQDPIANTHSEISDYLIYLPGAEFVELPFAAAPVGGVVYNADNKWAIGTSFYTPAMFGYTRDSNDPGAIFGEKVALSRMTYFSPTFAYQVFSNFSMGISVGFSYVGFGVSFPLRSPSSAVKFLGQLTDQTCGRRNDLSDRLVLSGLALNLCEGSISPYDELIRLNYTGQKELSLTYNIGLLWEATPWLNFGFVYQSSANDNLKGDVELELGDGISELLQGISHSNPGIESLFHSLGIPAKGEKITSKSSVRIPLSAHASIGTSIRVLPRLKLNIDVKWTDISDWNEIYFVFEKKLQLLNLLSVVQNIEPDGIRIPRGYEDTVSWGVGLEYQLRNSVLIRLGYEPRKTGIPDHKLDPIIPLGDSDLFGIGASFRLNHSNTFDISLGYLTSDEYIPAGSSTNSNDHRQFDNLIYNPAAGLDLKNKTQVYLLEMEFVSTF